MARFTMTEEKQFRVTQLFMGASSYNKNHRGGDWNINTRGIAKPPILAPEGPGVPVVEYAQYGGAGDLSTYGYWVQLRYEDGHSLRLAHMLTLPLVSVGQKVPAGTVLGYQGATGSATAAHVHGELLAPGKTSDIWGRKLLSPFAFLGSPNQLGTFANTYTVNPAEPEKTEKEWDNMFLNSFGGKNMQGFSQPSVDAKYLVYDKMPAGYRVVTRKGLAGLDTQSGQWPWVELLDERTGAKIYTPIISDRNKLVDDAPLWLPAGGGDGDCAQLQTQLDTARAAMAAASIDLRVLLGSLEADKAGATAALGKLEEASK